MDSAGHSGQKEVHKDRIGSVVVKLRRAEEEQSEQESAETRWATTGPKALQERLSIDHSQLAQAEIRRRGQPRRWFPSPSFLS